MRVGISVRNDHTLEDDALGFLNRELGSFDVIGEVGFEEGEVVLGSRRCRRFREDREGALVQVFEERREQVDTTRVVRISSRSGDTAGRRKRRFSSPLDGSDETIQPFGFLREPEGRCDLACLISKLIEANGPSDVDDLLKRRFDLCWRQHSRSPPSPTRQIFEVASGGAGNVEIDEFEVFDIPILQSRCARHDIDHQAWKFDFSSRVWAADDNGTVARSSIECRPMGNQRIGDHVSHELSPLSNNDVLQRRRQIRCVNARNDLSDDLIGREAEHASRLGDLVAPAE